jgi:hypothetical protein
LACKCPDCLRVRAMPPAPVPETAVHKHRHPLLRKNEAGSEVSRDRSGVNRQDAKDAKPGRW